MPETITSFQNPRLKQVKRLRDKKSRLDEGLFVIDDERDLIRAFEHGYEADYALICEPLLKAAERTVIKQIHPNRQFFVPKDMMSKVAYRDNPSGLVVVMKSIPQKGVSDLTASDKPILVLVNLQKPGNIGALLRTADATGFNHVLLVDTALDLYNPNIIRSSTGACFLQTTYALSPAEALNFLQKNEYSIVSAAVDGDILLYKADLRGKIAIVLGTEDVGLPDSWMQSAHQRVKIPMVGQLSDSFNVSVSGAIFMMEALRQNHF